MTAKATHKIFSSRSVIAICLVWLIINSVLFWKHGVAINGEPEKYISEANRMLTEGRFSSSNFWTYFTEIFLIMVTIKLKLGFIFVVIIQWAFNLTATITLFRFTSDLFNKKAALISTLLFLVNYPLQEFNLFLQTDSLFYSLTIILSCFLLRLQTLKRKNLLLIFCLMAFIAITRPTGLLFIPPVLLYLFFRFFPSIRFRNKLLILGVCLCGFFFLLNLAIGSGGELDFMLPYRDERIICGVPTLPGFVAIRTANDPNSLYGLAYYITHNFDQFIRMAFKRSLVFWGVTRGYYSLFHNVFLILLFYPIYLAMILSLGNWYKRNSYVLLYFSSVIIMVWICVTLTCDDWHNRFFISISPYLNILGLPFLIKLFNIFAADGQRKHIQ